MLHRLPTRFGLPKNAATAEKNYGIKDNGVKRGTPVIRYREHLGAESGGIGPGKRIFRFQGFEREDRDIRSSEIRPGLELNVTDLKIRSPREVVYEIGNTPVCFAFMLSGQSINRIRGRTGQLLHVTAGTNCVTCLEDIQGRLEFRPENGVACVSIYISSDLLAAYLTHCGLDVDQTVRGLLAPSGSRFFIHQDRMTSAMVTAARDIVACPEALPARALYLEAKALELLFLKITQWAEPSPGRDVMSLRDRQIMADARQMLLGRMADPPKIGELARLAGTNEFKLKKGFRSVYGQTVYGCLRQARMERAKHLMKQDGFNVSQAAIEVGYVNVSHFIRSYRSCYGINPGQDKHPDISLQFESPREIVGTGKIP